MRWVADKIARTWLLVENIRIEESPRLISLWIGKFVWTRDQERGQIQNVSVSP